MLIPEEVQVHLYCGITSVCKSINTLAILVQEVFGMPLSSGHLFLFRSRCRSKLKALYYEEFGFTLWYRRLGIRAFTFLFLNPYFDFTVVFFWRRKPNTLRIFCKQ
ncbi:IS66 family insertion sequence element accessory protein TnpB [Legionella waltersii]|uniref:IS66 Orf2 like protein n=1 Tax=Legionella waltersii TaxID=66969 RepID=A0A0W1APD7_9GAMM|nr:IS66 family insertion sequence element accessory protein TnpB [Legionella waltersii]KTD83134.1 IS66 Orf2 like protein [Legionella waltersii]SNU96845.1 IS66 Orf2 like protein [Legionella waltersii]